MSDVQKDTQPQQADPGQRAPQSAYEADAPRIEREPRKIEPCPFGDWASI